MASSRRRNPRVAGEGWTALLDGDLHRAVNVPPTGLFLSDRRISNAVWLGMPQKLKFYDIKA
ncbi:MAG: hypothetical protein RXR02_10630, partial [Thermoproteus sp.]